MSPDDIISYSELVAEERANLQKGVNFGIEKTYSVFLMSLHLGARGYTVAYRSPSVSATESVRPNFLKHASYTVDRECELCPKQQDFTDSRRSLTFLHSGYI